MKLREWATPLTIGAFALMAATGLLMFFHLDTAYNELAHEWVGLVLVAAVAAHAVANWTGFKRHFVSSPAGRAIVAVGLAALALSFVPFGGGKDVPPPVLAMRAVTKAPIVAVAALAGRPTESVVADLASAGVPVAGPEATLDSATGGDRGLQMRAMRALFGAPSDR